MDGYIVITFESTNFAMQAEAFVKSQNVQPQIIPTPREITLSCGLAIRLPADKKANVKQWIDKGGIHAKGVFSMTGQGESRRLEKLNLYD